MVIDFSSFYNPGSPFERLLETFWPGLDPSLRGQAYPLLNLSEDEKNIYLRCELPGLEIEDVELSLADSSLVIKGERRCAQGRYYRQERPSGAFSRVVNIQVRIDREAVRATLKDGLLEVVLPKAAPGTGRKISIEKA